MTGLFEPKSVKQLNHIKTKTIILIKTPSIHVIQSNITLLQKMRSNNKIQIEKRKRNNTAFCINSFWLMCHVDLFLFHKKQNDKNQRA